MKAVWFSILGFVVGSIVIVFVLYPSLTNPAVLSANIISFFQNIYYLQPKQYVALIIALLQILLLILAGLIGFMVWVTHLEKVKKLYEDEIYELRSQLSELLKFKER